MRKVALADILWNAANERLAVYEEDGFSRGYWTRPTVYSCNAIAHELGGISVDDLPPSVFEFVESLGCNCGDYHAMLLFELDTSEAIQGARYMWLLLAMHVAEDEGIMLEVA